jgi:hypothetical protein
MLTTRERRSVLLLPPEVLNACFVLFVRFVLLFVFMHVILSIGLLVLSCYLPPTHILNRASSVSIVSGYGLDDRAIEVRSPAGAKDFSSSVCVQIGCGAHRACCTMSTGGPFPGAKARQGRDADHSPPSNAEVENEQELYFLSTLDSSWHVVEQLYIFYTCTFPEIVAHFATSSLVSNQLMLPPMWNY